MADVVLHYVTPALFLDAGALGYATVLLHAAGLLVAVISIAGVLVAVHRLKSARAV